MNDEIGEEVTTLVFEGFTKLYTIIQRDTCVRIEKIVHSTSLLDLFKNHTRQLSFTRNE